MASTPAMFCATVYEKTDFDGSVMITASHLPMERNRMKFFDKTGGFDKPGIKAVLEMTGDINPGISHKRVESFDIISLYASKLCKKIKVGDCEKILLRVKDLLEDADDIDLSV